MTAILIVDDEPGYAQLVEHGLPVTWTDDWGRTDPMPIVYRAPSVTKAKEVLTRHGEDIAVIMCDVLLSHYSRELCGPALYWFVKEQWPKIAFVLKTMDFSEPTVRRQSGLDQMPPPGPDTYTVLKLDAKLFVQLHWLHLALFNEPPPTDP